MSLNLHIHFAGGRPDVEEQGFVMLNSIAIALELDAEEVFETLDPLMSNPTADFQRGVDHANTAFEKIAAGDVTAHKEFNDNMRGSY